MKTFLVAFVMTLIGLPSWAQDVQVKVDPKVKVKVDVKNIAKHAAMNVLSHQNINLDHDFDIDIDHDFDFNLDHDDNHNDANYEYQENSQEVEIPLSKPGERGVLDVSSHYGRIKITGYDGPTVKVKMTKFEKKVEKDASKNGMRLVSSGGFNFEAKEYNNVVKVENESYNNRLDFEIMVPKNFDIKADAYNNGHITVEYVNGQIDAESYNGPITLSNIQGSASASTYNGAIEVTFASMSVETPMAFSTYNGNVDISVPDGSKFSTKMKTNREIYTDFEAFTIKPSKPISNKNEKGAFNVKYENWVEGDLNGGGAEVMMKTTNGNIYIRKK